MISVYVTRLHRQLQPTTFTTYSIFIITSSDWFFCLRNPTRPHFRWPTLQDRQFSAAAVFQDMGHKPVSITPLSTPSLPYHTPSPCTAHAHLLFFLISCFWTLHYPWFTIFCPCSAFLYISLNTASFSMSARSFTPFWFDASPATHLLTPSRPSIHYETFSRLLTRLQQLPYHFAMVDILFYLF